MTNAKHFADLLGKIGRICVRYKACEDCPPRDDVCEAVLAAVEDYRKHKKPKPEVIDKAVDVYTIEVEIERGKFTAQVWTPKQGAECIADYIKSAYQGNCTAATATVLSAKRFVLESHREDEDE